ncbi:MAG TPA: hypothetical protein PLA12_01330 [Candidatus Hydrogenedens sp.]|nr:hypothetical protein [Candidatus Hydrogenedens sp.]
MNIIFNKMRNPFFLLLFFFLLLILWLSWIFVSPIFSRATAYKKYIQETTTGYIILQPYKVQKYIRKLAPTATRWIKQIPRFTSLQPGPIRLDWFHNLPREFSLLFDYIPGTGFETHLIIREKRNSTAFMEELNSSHFLNEFCFINWRSPLSSNIQRDLWINEGFVYKKTSSTSINTYKSSSSSKLLKNKHLLEFLWINREQNATDILDSLVRCFPRLNNAYLPAWQRALNNTDWVYFNLNLIEDNLVAGTLIIHPITPTGTMEIKEGILTFHEWTQSQLPSPIQLEINETTSSEDLNWEIRFYDFETRLKRALGNFSD